jgi:hypothetical protein
MTRSSDQPSIGATRWALALAGRTRPGLINLFATSTLLAALLPADADAEAEAHRREP